MNARNAEPARRTPETPFVVEYYYKAKWGFADEFARLFQKNHLPILKKQIESGRLLEVKAEKPRYHATEDGRWDSRVTSPAEFATPDRAREISARAAGLVVPPVRQASARRPRMAGRVTSMACSSDPPWAPPWRESRPGDEGPPPLQTLAAAADPVRGGRRAGASGLLRGMVGRRGPVRAGGGGCRITVRGGLPRRAGDQGVVGALVPRPGLPSLLLQVRGEARRERAVPGSPAVLLAVRGVLPAVPGPPDGDARRSG